MGGLNHDPRIPYPVFTLATSNKDTYLYNNGQSPTESSLAGGAVHSPGKGSYKGGALWISPGRVFLPTQQVSPAPAMPVPDSPQGETGSHCRRLVCHHRPQRCIFPDTHLEGSLAVPAVGVCRQGVRVPSSAIRHFSGTTNLHSPYGCGPLPTEAGRDQDPKLPRRLAGLCSLGGAVLPPRSPAVEPCLGLRSAPELQKEQA